MNKYILKYTSKTGFAGQGSRNQFVEFQAPNDDLAKGIAAWIAQEKEIEGDYDVLQVSHVAHVEQINSQERQAA